MLDGKVAVITGGATGHFGTQAIHGVVTCSSPDRARTQGLCEDDGHGYGDGRGERPDWYGGGSHDH